MPVVEKYRVRQSFKWLGKQYQPGDAISRDTILSDAQVGESKLGTLQRVRFIEPDPQTRPLDKMTKSELVEYAREVGASVDPNWRKSDILEEIEGAIHGS